MQEAKKLTKERRKAQERNTVLDAQWRDALKEQLQSSPSKFPRQLPFKEGYMHKLGSFRKNWLQRWFVLNEGTLQYYGAESDTKPKKLVVLNEACKFGPSTEHVEGKICFQIHYWGDSLSLYADTTEEMEE